ncbi:MAG: hypothetical protein WBZ24_12310 [Anaerolineales bacterium]|jgi:hypothetical protein
MMLFLTPLFHGTAGWWDEILCLIPSLLLVGLVLYMVWSDRQQKARAKDDLDSTPNGPTP